MKGLNNFQCPHLSTNGGFTSSFGPSSDVLATISVEIRFNCILHISQECRAKQCRKRPIIIPCKDEVFNISNTELFSETLLFVKSSQIHQGKWFCITCIFLTFCALRLQAASRDFLSEIF